MRLQVGGVLVSVALAWSSLASAQLVFRDSFEPPEIRPLFPRVAGEVQLPSGPTADQLMWILSELASNETTTQAEVEARFVPSYDPATMADFIETVRDLFPDAFVTEVISLTPLTASVLIDTPGGSDPLGLVRVNAGYNGDHLINLFGVSNFPANADNQFAADRSLTLQEVGDEFETLASDVGLLVARIEENGACTPILGRNESELLATGSIFKEWVLGGAARAVDLGEATLGQTVELVQGKRAVVGGDAVNREPNGTQFTLRDVAQLMMAISDNTATDLLHGAVGRDTIDDYIAVSGVADPSVLQPILNTTEQFHLYWSFPLSEAQEYVNGTEMAQQQFLQDRIVPLGNNFTFAHTNDPILTSGTWRASPMDICANFSTLRDFPAGSDAFALVDEALGASTGLARLRGKWDRVWFKGGSLASAATGTHVLTYSWLVEDNGRPAFVVVGMTNDPDGGINMGPNQGRITSILARLLDLVHAGL